MKWRIKNPAPQGNHYWGDYHFGKSLADHLSMLGEEVFIDYQGQWDRSENEDVVIVLRGLYPYTPRGDAFHILWIISHPERVTDEELASYQLICSASVPYTYQLKTRVNLPVVTLLQATDTRRFKLKESGQRSGLLFVGNTRGIQRPGVNWCVELDADLEVYGSGWSGRLEQRSLAGSYLPNEVLGDYYARAKLVLNDHYTDMRELGFINNRTFDALACGTPLLCDHHPALQTMFPKGVLFYKDKHHLKEQLDNLLKTYPKLLREAGNLAGHIAQVHSFAARARSLMTLARVYGVRRTSNSLRGVS